MYIKCLRKLYKITILALKIFLHIFPNLRFIDDYIGNCLKILSLIYFKIIEIEVLYILSYVIIEKINMIYMKIFIYNFKNLNMQKYTKYINN